MELADLKGQYRVIKASVDVRIQRVLDLRRQNAWHRWLGLLT